MSKVSKKKDTDMSKTELLLDLVVNKKKTANAAGLMLLKKYYPDDGNLVVCIQKDVKKIFRKFKSKKNIKKLNKVINVPTEQTGS